MGTLNIPIDPELAAELRELTPEQQQLVTEYTRGYVLGTLETRSRFLEAHPDLAGLVAEAEAAGRQG